MTFPATDYRENGSPSCMIMQQALEQALDHAEYVIATAQQRPPKRKYSSSGETSLQEKLYDIYVEECEKQPEVTEELRSNVNLLEKLLRRESLPCLVINLYPGKQGYSVMLKGKHGSYSESIPLPYEEGELLEYLDSEELPPVLVDLLDKSAVNVFHQGCVIAEVRDYRQSSAGEPPRYQSRHILLRPTMQTLVCDVEAIASDDQNWTQEDKLLLESQLILATAEPLCLDPSVSVACTANRLLYNKQKLNTLPMKRSLKRYSAPALNRQQELSHCPPPPELRILTSCKKIRESKTSKQHGLKTFKAGKCVDTWKQRPCNLAVPSQVDVQKYAKGKESVRYEESQSTQEVLGDPAIGCKAAYQSQATRLTVRQPADNSLATGNGSEKEATREREPCLPQSSTDDHFKGFLPKPQTDAGRVVSQSEQLVQKSTQCPVQTAPSSSGSARLRQPSPGTQSAQPRIASIRSSAPDWGARPPPPLKRRPWSPEKSSCGDSFTSQQAGSSQARPSPGPAPQPPSLSQRSSVPLNRGSSLPAAAPSTTGALQRTPDVRVTTISPGLKVIKVVGPFCCSQASGRGYSPRAPAPVGIQPGQQPAGSRLPNWRSTPPPLLPRPSPPPPRTIQVLLENASDLKPFALVELPRSSPVWSSQQRAPQPCVYQLVPQRAPQRPQLPAAQASGTRRPGGQAPRAQAPRAQASGPQCPSAQTPGRQGRSSQCPGLQAPGAQGAAQPSTTTTIHAQPAVLLHLQRQQDPLQPRVPGLSPPGSGQSRPGLSISHHRVQASQAPRPPIYWRVLRCPVDAAPADPTAPPPRGPNPGSQTAGTPEGGPPAAPKP